MKTEDLLRAQLKKPTDKEKARIVEMLRAMRAVSIGQASAEQQKAAYAGFVEISGFYDLSFVTDDLGGDRVMIFREGRRAVGADILRIAKASNIEELIS